MVLIEVIFYIQGVSTIMAVMSNMFLVYLVKNHTKNKIGNYKYLLIIFACFETTYSLVVFFGMPTHFMADRSWLVFSHSGFIGDTRFAVLGPGLYCSFYQVWVGLVVIHFIYRYIVVCKEEWGFRISEHNWMKVLLLVIYLSQVIYSFVCGLYFCTRERILPELSEKVKKQFGIEHPENLGYILLRTRNEEGLLSVAGVATILNHYVLVGVSVVIIFYCGINIGLKIRELQRDLEQARHARLQHQMFFTLLVQTMVPIIFCHIPTAVYLTFPFWESDFSFGAFSTVFSLLTSINKFCDSIIVICCISDYRRVACRLLKIHRTAEVEPTTQSSEDPPISLPGNRTISPGLTVGSATCGEDQPPYSHEHSNEPTVQPRKMRNEGGC